MTAGGTPAGGTCPSCGAPVDVGDGCCESCGTELSPAVKFALDAGGMDNITVVLAPFPLARPQTLPRRTAR
jgi:predicted amidophosphoribosyltransferase